MGFKTARQALDEEIGRLKRRITRIHEEEEKLRDQGTLGPLRAEALAQQVVSIEQEIERAEYELAARGDALSARASVMPYGTRAWRNGNAGGGRR